MARERLKVEVEEVPGGHLVALANPEGLVKLLTIPPMFLSR